MLSIPELQALLEHITYLPGYELSVYQGRHEGQHIVIRADIPDSYHPGQTVTLDIHSPLPPMRDAASFHDWLLWRCQRIASHETREWFKVDGKPYSDPHGPDADHDL